MGYIKKVVQTGVEFADHYQMPAYVAKARDSSKIIDGASEKIVSLYCEKGSPLLEMVDDLTAKKINTVLDLTSAKVKQAEALKTTAASKVQEKTGEALELAKQTKASVYEKGIKAKDNSKAKYEEFKMFTSTKADETKTIMRKRIVDATEEASRLEQKLETKLKEKASTNEYANKVLSVVMTAKNTVKTYGHELVKTSLALPLTIKERMQMEQERMESLIISAEVKVNVYTTEAMAKRADLQMKLKKVLQEKRATMFTYYGKMTPDNALVAVRKVFGDNAALIAEGKYQELKKAKLQQKFADKMASMKKYSIYQVGKFAEMVSKMEAQYVGTSYLAPKGGK
jgi:hypothetical protein